MTSKHKHWLLHFWLMRRPAILGIKNAVSFTQQFTMVNLFFLHMPASLQEGLKVSIYTLFSLKRF